NRDAWEGPKVTKQPPPPPPKKPKALTITADCEHDATGGRRIREDQVLEVVPQQKRNYTDPIRLTAETRPIAPTQPEWGITSVGLRSGYFATFDAESPKVGRLQNWIPKRTLFRNYEVSCKDGNGNSERLTVRAYPPMESLGFDDRALRSYIDNATASIRKV